MPAAQPRKAGKRSLDAPAADSRILTGPDLPELPVFKHTQLGAPFIRRSDIERAAYNPRTLDLSGKKKLREGLKRYGLVERPVFNCLTGTLIGGHQRLEQMDKLMEYGKTCPDYLVPINAVSMDATREKELNVLLNNPSVQGNYDAGALEQMFSENVNPFAAGFDRMELDMMFGGDFASELAARFGGEAEPDEAPVDNAGAGFSDADQREAEARKIDALKARKREQVAEDGDRETSDTILHIVFASRKALRDHLKGLGFDPAASRFLDAERYREAQELELSGGELE